MEDDRRDVLELRRQTFIADEVEKLKASLPQLRQDAASQGKQVIEIGKFLSGHDRFVWRCGKGPSESWFSHKHKKSCLVDKYRALWDMLEAEGLEVSLHYNARANGAIGTYGITAKI
jgi:hypothetical protein